MHRNVRHDVLHPKLRIALRDISSGKSARIVALVLDPHPHVALRQFAHNVLHQVHVARRKVRRLAVRHIAPPGRKVDHEDAVRLHLVQVEGDPLSHVSLVRAVPALELLHRAILARRRDEVRRNLRRRRHRNHLPRTRLGLLCACACVCAAACACAAVVSTVKNKTGKRKSGTSENLRAAFIASTPDR